MYRVYYTNFQYYAQPEFKTLLEAGEYAKSKGFQAGIEYQGMTVATFCPIAGFRVVH